MWLVILKYRVLATVSSELTELVIATAIDTEKAMR